LRSKRKKMKNLRAFQKKRVLPGGLNNTGKIQ